MLDFPVNPTVGQRYTSATGSIYEWDGVGWSVITEIAAPYVLPPATTAALGGVFAGQAPVTYYVSGVNEDGTLAYSVGTDLGVTGPVGPQGETGPAGPTAVSGDIGNKSTLGNDGLIYTPWPTAADIGAAPVDHTHPLVSLDAGNTSYLGTDDLVYTPLPTPAMIGAAPVDHNHDGVYAPLDHTHPLLSTDLYNKSILGSDGLIFTPKGEQIATSDTPPPGAKVGDLWFNPTNGQLHVYYQDANSTQWVSVSGLGGGSAAGGSSVTTGDTPPASPAPGDLWYCSTDGQLYVYYTDADSSQWVSTTGGAETYVLPAATQTTLGGVINGPSFAAHGSVFQTLTTSVTTKVSYNTELFDTHGCYDPALFRFTPTVAGYYLVTAKVVTNAINVASAACTVYIYKNGAAYVNNTSVVTNTNGFMAQVTAIVPCNGTTDYIDAYILQNMGAALNGGSNSTVSQFSGAFMRAA
jgi:hypothetical protein